MPLFKKRNPGGEPPSSESGYLLRRDCPSCRYRANFDWAVCPNCGALAGGDLAVPADVIEPTRAMAGQPPAQPAERARFSEQADFYRPMTPVDFPEPFVERTDPNIEAATLIERTDPQIPMATVVHPMVAPPAPPAPVVPPARPANPAADDKTVILRPGPPREEGITRVEPPPANVTRGPLAFVIERTGPEEGRAHLLSGETHLGRSPECEVAIANSAVSKRHARIRYQDGDFIFWDLASANFSFLVGPDGDRTRLLEPHRLADGDTLDLADARITFVHIDAGDLPG